MLTKKTYSDHRSRNETHAEHIKRVCIPEEAASCVTFENANEFVHALVHLDQEAARAVKRELEYWNDKLGEL